MNSKSAATLRCPLCGFEFSRADAPCHHGCPMASYCNLVACPNCRYEFPPESETPSLLKRLFGHHTPKPANGCVVINLTDLPAGAHGELVSLNSRHGNRRNALAVFGLVPGCQLTLQQKRPTYVIRVGETELALEADIAREILVKPITPVN